MPTEAIAKMPGSLNDLIALFSKIDDKATRLQAALEKMVHVCTERVTASEMLQVIEQARKELEM